MAVASNIPTFLICRDIRSWPEAMIPHIERMGGIPIIIDNASTYGPLLDWYASDPCEVVRLPENVGHHSPWLCGAIERIVPENGYYVVSDPDLNIAGCPDETIQHCINLLDRYPSRTKAGLSIEIKDLPPESPVYHNAIGWESKFWQRKMPNDWQCYDAPIDTTFAVYNKRRRVPLQSSQFMHAVRADRPFTCQHLPFYLTTANFTHEMWHYLKHATHGPATMPRYLQGLVQDYESKNPRKCRV